MSLYTHDIESSLRQLRLSRNVKKGRTSLMIETHPLASDVCVCYEGTGSGSSLTHYLWFKLSSVQ